LPAPIQEHLQTLVLPPIKRLASGKDGVGLTKVLALIENAPTGCDTLVLRILGALSEKGRMAEPLSKLIKTLAIERDLSARYLIPIIGELGKTEILHRLPRVVALLNGTQAERDVVRGVFESVLTTPEQVFGAVSTNVPRTKHLDLLTPVELLVLLHTSEKETGLKPAIEGAW
jgi:symplekin